MPLPRKYIGHVYGTRNAQVLIEAYLDLICPFSKKTFPTLKAVVDFYGKDKVSFAMVQYAQPWHHQSPILHRAVLAVNVLDEEKTMGMIEKIYRHYESFVDAEVENKSREQLAEELARIAATDLGVDEAKFRAAMFGEEATQLLKFHTRHGRQTSVHVTPTVFVNGIILSEHSSGWTLEDWRKQLDPLFS